MGDRHGAGGPSPGAASDPVVPLRRGGRGSVPRLVPAGAPVLSLTKGIEIGTLARPSEILRETLDRPRVTALSGPSFADEVARELPATVVVAAPDEADARFWHQA